MTRLRLPARVRLAAIAAGVLLLLAPLAPASAASLDGVCERVTEVATSRTNVTAGVVLIDLATGERCEVAADREFRTASLYKTIVLAELYRQIDAGLVRLEDPLLLQPHHSVDDPPELRLTGTATTTVGEAALRMIQFSENVTALALREHLGISLVDAAPAWLGMPETELGGRFVSTPADQAELYRRIYAGEVVSPEASRAMYLTLAGQEIADLIPAGLPAGVPIAHKTGTLDVYLHDAGIVRAPGGDMVLIVMTEHASFNGAMEAIHEIAATAFEPFANEAPPVLAPMLVTESRPEALPASTLAQLQAESAATAGAAPSDGGGLSISLPEVNAAPWSNSTMLTILLAFAAIVVAVPVWMMRRSGPPLAPAFSYGTNGPSTNPAVAERLSPADRDVRERADRTERGVVMRFGTRRDEGEQVPQTVPASRSVAEVQAQPVLPSRRLQRLAEHFQAQSELLTSMRSQFEDEMEPLQDLLQQQAHAMHRLLANLEERLRPLNEYADSEEANLGALERRIQDGGSDHVARNFQPYLEEQRGRIARTREQIDQQRVPFVQYGEHQRETIESALARFDHDIEALEQNLADQRRVMMRMLDAMRSDTFAAVKEYLASRQGALSRLAESGSTDPGEIGRTVQQLRRSLEQMAGSSDYARSVLSQADAADQALISVAPGRPRALREEPVVESQDIEADETEEASA